MPVAVDGLDRDFLDAAGTQHFERDVDPRVPGLPQLDVEIGLALYRLPADADDHVARADVRVIGRAFRGDAGYDHVALHFLRVDADPRARARRRLAGGDEIAQQRLQQVDRHEHVAGDLVAGAHGIAHHQ